MKDNFSQFGVYFQEALCQMLLEDRPFADQLLEVIKIEYLELKYLRTFAEKVIKYREKYDTHPSIEVFTSVLQTELEHENDANQKLILDYYQKIQDGGGIVRDAAYIKTTALDFCKKQALKSVLLSAATDLKNDRYDIDKIEQELRYTLSLGTDTGIGYDYHLDFEARYREDLRLFMPTGWTEMDSHTKGGLKQGQLGVVIGSTGAGKSICLVNLGAAAIRLGKNVVYYTLELDQEEIGLRFDSCLTGIKIDDLMPQKDIVHELIKKMPGKLTIKEYLYGDTSVNTLRNHLAKLNRQGFTPDLVLVDYGDELTPGQSFKEMRHGLQSIYKNLRATAKEFNVPLWTATQTNRGGVNCELNTLESISEAYSKCFPADIIFTLSRTLFDKEKEEGRFFMAKNRNGPDGLVYPIFMRPSAMKIKVLPNVTLEEVLPSEEDKEERKKDVKQSWLEKWKKERKEEQ